MSLSPLQLERSFFRRVCIEAAVADDAVPPHKVETKITTGRHPTDKHRFRIDLVVVLLPEGEGEKPSGYTGEVEVCGFFRIADEVPEEKRERIVAVNGCTILYGMAREMVCNVTARGPFPMVVLPTVSFLGVHPVPLQEPVTPA